TIAHAPAFSLFLQLPHIAPLPPSGLVSRPRTTAGRPYSSDGERRFGIVSPVDRPGTCRGFQAARGVVSQHQLTEPCKLRNSFSTTTATLQHTA
ncbi:unnamed protein product, partial [Sphacelaria rigidula]